MWVCFILSDVLFTACTCMYNVDMWVCFILSDVLFMACTGIIDMWVCFILSNVLFTACTGIMLICGYVSSYRMYYSRHVQV